MSRRLAVVAICVVAAGLLIAGLTLSKRNGSGAPGDSPAPPAGNTGDMVGAAQQLTTQGKLRDAVALLAKAKTASPRDTSILVTRAGLLAQLGQSREAWDDMLAAHKIAADDPQITLELLRIAPQFVPAADKESYAREGIKQASEKAITHYYLGMAIIAANDPKRYKEAMAAFDEANRIAPNQQLVPLEMGKLTCRMGDYLRGAAWLENAWSLIDAHDQDHSTPATEITRQRQAASYWLAEAYRHIGKTKEAKEMAARAEKYAAQVREIEALQVRAVAEPPDLQAAARLKEIEAQRQ